MTRREPEPGAGLPGRAAAAALAALIRESVASGAVRDVLHLRLSGLPSFRHPHHGRLLREALAPALGGGRTRVFDLPNGDLVAVAPPPAPALEEAARALRRTLDLVDETALSRLRLPDAAAELLLAASGALGLEPVAASAAPASAPLGSEALAGAERDLAIADLEPFTRRLTVCELATGDAVPRPLWQDLRLDWPSLAAALLPGTALGAAEGLPARLAKLAAARLLAELARPAAQLRWRPVGLALPPALLGSPAFHRFDAALPAGRRAEVTISFRPADILADPTGFAAAREAARARRYRLALDDAAVPLLEVLPPGRLGLDLVRLRWDPGLPSRVSSALGDLLAAADAASRVVLSGVDRPAAIAWGWEAGLRLFQGPLVERGFATRP